MSETKLGDWDETQQKHVPLSGEAPIADETAPNVPVELIGDDEGEE